MTLHVGYAEDIITPSLERPVYLAGFGQNRRAESIHDDLHAKALALSDGVCRVILVALDLIGLSRHHCREAERQVEGEIRNARLIIACTHTHHGPDTIGLWGSDQTEPGVDPVYMAQLKEKIVAVSLAAWRRLQPADMRSTSSRVTGVAKNARDPKILDEELTSLQFCSPVSRESLVTWLIYPCHPEVLWDDNPVITSDYIHAMRRKVEARTGAPCMAMVGSLGGMMTPDMNGNTFNESETMGKILGCAAVEALEKAELSSVRHLSLRLHEFVIPMENPLFQMAMRAGLLANFLNEDGTITSEASLLRLDDTWVFAVPGELLPKLGLAYKAEMKKRGGRNTAVIGLANDELGYILPAEEFVYPDDPLEPGEHYEETMSIGIETGPRLTAALHTLLATCAGNTPQTEDQER